VSKIANLGVRDHFAVRSRLVLMFKVPWPRFCWVSSILQSLRGTPNKERPSLDFSRLEIPLLGSKSILYVFSHWSIIWLVFSTPLKNMSSSVGSIMSIMPNIWKNKKCSKPPPRSQYYLLRGTPWLQTIGFLHPSAQLSRCRRGPVAPNAEKKHMRQHPGLNLALRMRGSCN